MNDLLDWDALLPEPPSDYVGAAVIDTALQVRAADDSLVARSGVTRAEFMQRTALDFIHPSDLDRAAKALAATQSIEGARLPGMFRLMLGDGDWNPFEVRATNLSTGGGGAMVLQLFEVTDEFMADAFAAEVVETMELLVSPGSTEENLGRVVDFAERYVRDMTMAITTFDLDGIAMTASLRPIPPEAQRANAAALPTALPAHVDAAVDELLAPGADPYRPGRIDEEIPGRVTLPIVIGERPPIAYVEAYRPTSAPPSRHEWLVYSSVVRIVTTALLRARLDARLEYAANHDSLTGLFNRRRLLELIEVNATAGALLMVDLDNFSWINNTLGHMSGDRALRAVAASLSKTAPDEALVARWGGDEFVVWVPTIHDLDTARALAEELRVAMVIPVEVGDRRSTIRCSIGAALLAAGETPEDALNRADRAMYRAKQSGGNRADDDRSAAPASHPDRLTRAGPGSRSA